MSDTKHGWVTPRADGARARCGGPEVCGTCQTEQMHETMLTGVFGVVPQAERAAAAAPCPTCNDQGAVGNILTAQPCPDCTPSPASVAPGDAQAERMQKRGFGSVSFTLSDGFTVSCEWSPSEWGVSIPAKRLDRDVAFKELLQEIGRLRAVASPPAAGDALAYGSPADVAQRIEQYLNNDGRKNSATQLLYEAMKALRGPQKKGEA